MNDESCDHDWYDPSGGAVEYTDPTLVGIQCRKCGETKWANRPERIELIEADRPE